MEYNPLKQKLSTTSTNLRPGKSAKRFFTHCLLCAGFYEQRFEKSVHIHLFDEIPKADIEMSTFNAGRELEFIEFGPDENIDFFDVKSLFANVPVFETISFLNKLSKTVLRSLYSSDYAPKISRSTLKSLLKIAVTHVCSKSVDSWFLKVLFLQWEHYLQ